MQAEGQAIAAGVDVANHLFQIAGGKGGQMQDGAENLCGQGADATLQRQDRRADEMARLGGGKLGQNPVLAPRLVDMAGDGGMGAGVDHRADVA